MSGEDDPLEVFSHEGPMCPRCKEVRTVDEAFYFDENGYDLECECGTEFRVHPLALWTWTSRIRAKPQ